MVNKLQFCCASNSINLVLKYQFYESKPKQISILNQTFKALVFTPSTILSDKLFLNSLHSTKNFHFVFNFLFHQTSLTFKQLLSSCWSPFNYQLLKENLLTPLWSISWHSIMNLEWDEGRSKTRKTKLLSLLVHYSWWYESFINFSPNDEGKILFSRIFFTQFFID